MDSLKAVGIILLLAGVFLTGSPALNAQEYSQYGEGWLSSQAHWLDYPEILDRDAGQTFSGALHINAHQTLSYDWGEVKLFHQLDWLPPASGEPGEADFRYQLYEASLLYWWGDALTLRAGRHTLPWGMGYAFYPADRFHPARGPQGDYAGFDGVSGTLNWGTDWSVTGALRMDGFFEAEEEWWKEARGLLVLSGYFGGVDAMVDCVAQWQEVLRPGAGLSLDLGGTIITLEGAAEWLPSQEVYYPREKEGFPAVSLETRPRWQPHYLAALGLERSIYLGDHTITLLGEYYYTQLGMTPSEADLVYNEEQTGAAYLSEAGYDPSVAEVWEEDAAWAEAAELYPAFGGQHYFFPRLAWDWDARLAVETSAYLNCLERSGIVFHSLGWTSPGGWALKVSGQWVWGEKGKTEAGMLTERASVSAEVRIFF